MMILFDIGNSRIKWQQNRDFSELPNAFLYHQKNLSSQLDKYLEPCAKPDHDVIIVSVAGDQINAQFESWVRDRWRVGVRFLRSEPQWKTLHNGYEKAEELGADRWYALIGALSRYSYPLIVCDIGSAVTIDIVDQNGAHLGGYIVPGLEMMVRSMNSETDINIKTGQFARKHKGEVVPIPRNTRHAINEGCLWAIASLIDSINKRVDAGNTTILTGGSAEKIASLLNIAPIIDNNLIFYGIESVIETS